MFASFTSSLIVAFARLVTAVRGIWLGIEPRATQRVYFANHASNGDFVLLWSVLPKTMRSRTRPVAAADYWLKSRLKTFIGRSVFNAVLIERDPAKRTKDPVEAMVEALDAGDSLILFPEGTRNTTGQMLLPFKSGLFHLAGARPSVDLVPVWIENLNRVMPKGKFIPIPLICTVSFGAPMHLSPGEDKAAFLKRAETALLALAAGAKGTGAKGRAS
ncbi:lysophospholipid acyltransferase family protein [Paracoccus pacificus]|uniref:Lysophospholipid acyltransferase family protein n=1 Tax=Paracoccus pacificus TaxID=1463598 RepID=A0ABW4R5B7_9RHOB